MKAPEPTVTVWGARGTLGTGGPGFERYGGSTICFEIHGRDGQSVFFDAGSGLYKMAQAAPARSRYDIFLSHLHLDHLSGLANFAPAYTGTSEVHLWCGLFDDDDDAFRAAIRTLLSPPFCPVDLVARGRLVCHAFLQGDRLEIGGMRVEPLALNHPGGAFGGIFHGRSGKTVIALDHEHGDAAADARLRAACDGCETLIYDAMYLPEEMPERVGWGHSTWQHAVALAQESGVERLILAHHAPYRSDAALEAILSAARAVFPATDLA